jgi:hypothetical protein
MYFYYLRKIFGICDVRGGEANCLLALVLFIPTHRQLAIIID